MHPLALPTALVQVALAGATVVAAYRLGAPWALTQRRWGKLVLAALALVFGLDVVFFVARALGAFGGPVPV